MNKKIIFGAVLIAVIAIGYYFWSTTKVETKPVELLQVSLSDKLDEAQMGEYFEEIYIGKLLAGVSFDPNNIVKANVITKREQFCSFIRAKKQIPSDQLVITIFDVARQGVVELRQATSQEIVPGTNITGCEKWIYGLGNFEMRVYLGESLIAKLPFEMK